MVFGERKKTSKDLTDGEGAPRIPENFVVHSQIIEVKRKITEFLELLYDSHALCQSHFSLSQVLKSIFETAGPAPTLEQIVKKEVFWSVEGVAPNTGNPVSSYFSLYDLPPTH